MAQVIQTLEQQLYLSKLLGYDYTIEYKPGSTNKVADALSRISSPLGQLLSLSILHFVFLDQLKQSMPAIFPHLCCSIPLHLEDTWDSQKHVIAFRQASLALRRDLREFIAKCRT